MEVGNLKPSRIRGLSEGDIKMETAEKSNQAVESDDLKQLLASSYEINLHQLTVLKKQLQWARWTSIILIVAVLVLMICLGSLFTRLNKTTKNIELVTAQLADADLPAMIEHVNDLVDSSQSSVQSASRKIDSIDIDALNQSIHDLNAIIEPLARLFGAR